MGVRTQVVLAGHHLGDVDVAGAAGQRRDRRVSVRQVPAREDAGHGVAGQPRAAAHPAGVRAQPRPDHAVTTQPLQE